MRLFLCEKPSQGADIAKVLGASRRGDGCLLGQNVTVTWCIGHLLETAPPEAYDPALKSWSLEHLPIIPQQWKLEVVPRTAKQFKVVKKLLGEASELVIATDADREGELIAREVIEVCGYRGPIQRLWLSALNPASVRKALGELRSGEATYPLYLAALARSRADWLIGMTMSRLFTLVARRSGHDILLTVGRVQTPTLSLVVNRQRAIANFVPKPFWQVEVRLVAHQQAFVAGWVPPADCLDEEGRCIDQSLAEQAARTLSGSPSALVTSVQVARVREQPPLPFDLATLQEVCNRQFGLGVDETLQIAQSLYETHKATHYPRTESGYLPESMLEEVPAVLDALVKTDPAVAPLVKALDLARRSQAWNDKKLNGPHHGIIPTTEPADISRMSEKERKVYDLIRRRYLAQFMPFHEFDRTTATLEASGLVLKATGKQIVVPGWKTLFAKAVEAPAEGQEAGEDDGAPLDEKRHAGQVLPALVEGMACAIQQAGLKTLTTQPPALYTEGTLLKAMKGIAALVQDPRLKAKLRETTGIGTQATRAAIIHGLIQRGYLAKRKKALEPTASAFALIDAMPPAIKDPGMTAIWEQACEEIEAGRLSLQSFLDKQAAWITQLVQQCAGMTLSIDLPAGPSCPLCGEPMRKRKGPSGFFWGCFAYPDCKGVLAVESGKKRSSGTEKSRKAAGSNPV